ncbi:MAG: amino acid permease [Propionibacteriaceae bacterium]|jgi:lysine-specific permease|nr:amino acid permease [Propionibacteriaceae bacterium]
MTTTKELSENGEGLHRSIKSRHLTMIAVGGTIGTGVFFASGNAISSIGPGGAILAFGLMGVIVYLMMQGLGEMTTQLPISGSFEEYASRFIDPALGFTFGWNYWFCWAITVATEFEAGALIVRYWFPEVPGSIWALVFFILLVGLNLISARSFAESEYWFAGIKVVVIIVFLATGLLMILGLMGNSPGFSNWTLTAVPSAGGDPVSAPLFGGIGGFMAIFLMVAFTFSGTELVGVAAAETENPQTNVPKAIRSVFWRLLVFYVGTVVVLGFLIPFNDPLLLASGVDNVAASPFTIVFQNAGLIVAASFMNAVVLTSVLSCGNSGLFCASRMLYAMGNSGKAPKIFAKTNTRGVPVYAVLGTSIVAAVSFATSLVGDSIMYLACINLCAVSGVVVWFGIAWSQLRFRKAWVAQGHAVEELKFRSKFYPWGPWVAMIVFVFIIFGSGYWIFQDLDPSTGEFWFQLVTNYILTPILVVMYLVYKKKYKTKMVKLEEADFSIPAKEDNFAEAR